MKEREIIERLKGGDKSALGELYEIYISSALRTAYLITSDKFAAEDIVSEAFIEVFKNINKLRKNEAFRQWLFRIIVRLSWKAGKNSGRTVPSENIEQLADGAGVRDEYFTREKYTPLYNAIDALSPKLRTTVVLYWFNEMTIKEIAKTMGCFEGTVKSRLFAAKRKLREILEEADL